MEKAKIAFQIRVTGKVQGVWFRASTQRKAEELGVRGFVKNEPDGSVYLEAEGTKAQLDLFLDWCHQGPIHAKVLEVEKKSIGPQGFENFVILR